MTNTSLQAQVHAAALRFADDLVKQYGAMLLSIVEDLTTDSPRLTSSQKKSATVKPRKITSKPHPVTAPKTVGLTAKKTAKKTASKPAKKSQVLAGTAKKTAPKKQQSTARVMPTTVKGASTSHGKIAPVRKKRVRRTMNDIRNTADRVYTLLYNNGAQMRMEEINRNLGTTALELAGPMALLITQGKVVKRGERRATTYSVR